MALGRKTGGRQRGTPNRATARKAAEIAGSGETPLEYLLRVMRDDAQKPEDRITAAKAAAPYVHPRLSAVELSGGFDVGEADFSLPDGTDIRAMSDEQLMAYLAACAREEYRPADDPVTGGEEAGPEEAGGPLG